MLCYKGGTHYDWIQLGEAESDAGGGAVGLGGGGTELGARAVVAWCSAGRSAGRRTLTPRHGSAGAKRFLSRNRQFLVLIH